MYHAQAVIIRYYHFYNTQRLHRSIGYLSPDQYLTAFFLFWLPKQTQRRPPFCQGSPKAMRQHPPLTKFRRT
ncbi:MAG: hypothetical protein LC115_09215 [Bacteroidia bacterium]|nr:hypothetical protein [Bacteroidia bacterium]